MEQQKYGKDGSMNLRTIYAPYCEVYNETMKVKIYKKLVKERFVPEAAQTMCRFYILQQDEASLTLQRL